MQVIAQQGDTLDVICVRYYGRSAGVFETVLAANPRLADAGPLIPYGTAVELPQVQSVPTAESINLWD